MLPRDVVVVVRIEGAEELHAIHELRDACGDVMVAVESDSTICDSFRSIYQSIITQYRDHMRSRLTVGSADSDTHWT